VVFGRHKTLLFGLGALALGPWSIVAPLRSSPPPVSPPRPAAQAPQQNAPVSVPVPDEGVLASISATGSEKFTSAQVVAGSGLKVGEPVTRQKLQIAANRLAATGLFSNVHYRYSSKGKNVNLEFQVADAPTVPVTFDNFPWFTNEQLDQIIRQSVGLFDGMAPEYGSYDDAIASAIENKLHSLGVAGRVEHRLIEKLVGSGMELQFRLVGPALNVGSVQFTDPLASHDERVQQRLRDVLGKPFSRYYINVFVTEQVRPIYLSQGYLRVRFGPPQARFSGNPNQVDLNKVLVIVPVTPGARFTWAGASWNGNTVFKSQELDRMLGMQPGSTADGLAIEAGWEKIRQAYGQQGYLDASLDPEPVYDKAKATVSYNVNVTEGEPYKMGKLVIAGLSVEAERRVRKAWKIDKGKTFDQDYFHAFVSDIAKEALGDLPVHYQHIGRFLNRHPEKHTVDVMLDFR
jgi:outer membrane protein insertion porin family